MSLNRGPAHRICNLKYSAPKTIPIAFHNGSNYNYCFIIKDLAKEFEKQFTYVREKHWKIHNLYRVNGKRSSKDS